MPDEIRYFGLCMSCKNASSCTFPRDPTRPAFYCEEFEVATTASTMSFGEDRGLVTGSDASDEDSEEFIGLCSDCEVRRDCTFPKPEGGIWCCEEYR
jgi:hypothetical protein